MPVVNGISRGKLRVNGEHNHDSQWSSTSFPSSIFSDPDIVISDGKETMQNLNDRLAIYLQQVKSLEAKNRELENKIEKHLENKLPGHGVDFSNHYLTITELFKQIAEKRAQNGEIILQMATTTLAALNYEEKYEKETQMHLKVEEKLARLKKKKKDYDQICKVLKMLHEDLKEESVFLKKKHGEDMLLQSTVSADVRMSCSSSADLTKELQEMREQYETVITKNRRDAQIWFEGKVDVLQRETTVPSSQASDSQTEVTELSRTLRSLDGELKCQHSQVVQKKKHLFDLNNSYSVKLSQLQEHINSLEAHLQQLNISTQAQASEYQTLLDIKMRLEMEIAEYRRLVDGEDSCKLSQTNIKSESSTMTEKTLVTEEVSVAEEIKAEEVEVRNPLIQMRVKTIVEQIVDGKVVSSTVDEKVEDISSPKINGVVLPY